MTRETRQYLNRIRKAQDAVLNGKATDKTASLDMGCRLDCNEHKGLIITVQAGVKVNDQYICKAAYIWPWFTTEKIEAELAECSKLIGITI